MNEEFTLNFIKIVVGSFAFGKRLLPWDSFECHMVESIKEALNSVKVHTAIIPGECTKHIQAPDVSLNKPFKAYIAEKYDKWLYNFLPRASLVNIYKGFCKFIKTLCHYTIYTILLYYTS